VRRRWRSGVAAAVLASLLAAAGCGGESGPDDTDREAILAVLDRARDAMVEGRLEEACGLLTTHGYVRARNYGPAYEDTPTCERALRYVVESERQTTYPVRTEALRQASFEVLEVKGDQAVVRAVSRGADATIALRREPDAGWRIHDSDVVPVGD
jgi:hypothetical protein